MSDLTAAQAIAMVRLSAERLREAAPELSRMDAAAGDGDHGANVAAAFSSAEARIEAEQPDTPAAVFALLGRTWGDSGGGAAGALFATLFKAIGQRFEERHASTENLVAALELGTLAVQDLGHARVGDRSLVDALAPAVEDARIALSSGADLHRVLTAAALGARKGASSSATMPAKAGRAKYSPERAMGTPDPGAVSVSIVLAAWADAVSADQILAGGGSDDRGRHLDRLATAEGQFAILALDHVRSFAATMRPDDPSSLTDQTIWDWKGRLLAGLAGDATAVLIDPAFAATHRAASSPAVGLIIGLEDSDYGSIQESPRLVPGWTVERAARMGADAVKVSFLFGPDDDETPTVRFISDLVRECSLVGLPLLCEPLASPKAAGDMRRTVVEAVHRFGELGVDVMKVQFPGDLTRESSRAAWADGCLEVDQASPVPWALLSEGREFDQFRELLAIACDAGASGFVAGRAIWGIALDHPDAIRQSAKRLAALRSIAATHGRPWPTHRGADHTDGTGRGGGPHEAQAQEVGDSALSQ